MANIKISDLTAASSVADANEFEINESGTSKKVTASQIQAYIESNLTSGSLILKGDGSGGVANATATNGTAGQYLKTNADGTFDWESVVTFNSGTRMLFAQTAAPTGWTKDTVNYNNHSLRVVTGTASTGGSVDFTTAFTSQTPTGSVTITSVTGSAGATTLSTPQIPSHSHGPGSLINAPGNNRRFESSPGPTNGTNGDAIQGTTAAAGGGGSHSHPFSFSSGSGTFSGSAINLAVKYLDVITATKD